MWSSQALVDPDKRTEMDSKRKKALEDRVCGNRFSTPIKGVVLQCSFIRLFFRYSSNHPSLQSTLMTDFKEFPAVHVLGYSLDFTQVSPMDVKSVSF